MSALLPPRTVSRRTFLTGLAATISLGALGIGGCGSGNAPESPGTPAAVRYDRDSLLISVADLAEQAADPDTRIIDCSSVRTHRSGHVPGAAHIWWQDTIEINNPVYGMIASPDTRRLLLRRAGVGPSSHVVVYDDSGGVHAARVLWMLHTMSFHSVQLLDGGRQAWKAAGQRLTRESSEHDEGSFEGLPDEDVNAHAHDIEEWLGRDDIAVLDTRTAAERAETWHGQLRVGIIPGSIWLPRDQFFNGSQPPYLAGREAVINLLEERGVSADIPEIIVYGLHSTLAALPYLALRLHGVPRVRLYNGSWAEWGASERPIAALQ